MTELRREAVDTEARDLGRETDRRLHRVAASRHGMVSTQHHRATEIGIQILAEGGNAIDAAVACAFALGVCEPNASGLGGQTMMMLRVRGRRGVIALDGSSRAPNRATPDVVKQVDLRRGYCATTVPTTPAVLGYTLAHYGRLPLERILAPVIRLAEDGYRVTELQRALARREIKNLRSRSAADFFLRDGRRSYPVGSLFRQPVLAETLRRLAKKGIEDFYTGRIARQIHRDMRKNGGLLHRDDLARIPYPVERRPLACRFAGRRVFTFPPPGAGRTLIEMLQILEHFPPRRRDPDRPKGALLLAEAIRRAGLDRQDRPFDPSFYPQVLDKRMCSREYSERIAKKLRRAIRTTGETTHLSAMDREGNVVALTQSIERVYGSCVATPELGFLYNNYMMAFEYKDISHPYYLRPNAVPWASVAPTIVFAGRRPWLAIGSPGSERITSSIVQVVLRLHSQTPADAVAAPRLHCSIDGRVSLEAARMRDDIPKILEERGFRIDIRDPFSFYMGCVQLVMREGGTFLGVADPRRDGAAGGPRGKAESAPY